MLFARPDDCETRLYHFSLRFCTIVRSSYGPVACWILLRTSSLITWFLYEMHKIFRSESTSFPWLISPSVHLLRGSTFHNRTERWTLSFRRTVQTNNKHIYFCNQRSCATFMILFKLNKQLDTQGTTYCCRWESQRTTSCWPDTAVWPDRWAQSLGSSWRWQCLHSCTAPDSPSCNHWWSHQEWGTGCLGNSQIEACVFVRISCAFTAKHIMVAFLKAQTHIHREKKSTTAENKNTHQNSAKTN